jgi:hypothetical protein
MRGTPQVSSNRPLLATAVTLSEVTGAYHRATNS